jgi:hypothetical protein
LVNSEQSIIMNIASPLGVIVLRVSGLAIAIYLIVFLRWVWPGLTAGVALIIAFLLYVFVVIGISFVRRKWARIGVPILTFVGYVIAEAAMGVALPRQFDWPRSIDTGATAALIGLCVGGYFAFNRKVREYYDMQDGDGGQASKVDSVG